MEPCVPYVELSGEFRKKSRSRTEVIYDGPQAAGHDTFFIDFVYFSLSYRKGTPS